MANLHDIKRRRESVKSTQKITRAMKMVAASKLRRAQESIVRARPYAFHMGELVQHMSARAELDGHPLLRRNTTDQPVSLIVMTSDRGLCGAFNASVVGQVRHHVGETFAGREVQLTVIGRKGIELLRRRIGTLHAAHDGLLDGSLATAADLLVTDMVEGFVEKHIGDVYCLYNRFKSAISQEVTLERLLPFGAAERAESSGGSAVDFVYEPDAATLFDALLRRHLAVQMQRILNESTASEHGARMTAMDSATKNAGEMIERLSLAYNRARQDAITKELIEVVSGAEAL
jgi:F-type H+-transporting ATPase subunit gamma